MKLDTTKLHMMEVDKEVEAYTVGVDHLLDVALIEADCMGSAGHAAGLRKINVLGDQDYSTLIEGLVEIAELAASGEFEIRPEQEDVHTAIETHLTKTRGEVGKKIHACRSRNDQVVTALRLWSKWELIRIARRCTALANTAIDFAEKYKDIPMVGRTHMQLAMPSSLGLWMGALAEAMMDNLELLKSAYLINDQCPLGSAASYGVPIRLEREFVSKKLGFRRLQNNSLYVANSRGKIESVVLSAMSQIMMDLSRYAQDLIVFSMPEFGYFKIPVELTTGSSIMPQKRNPDALELLRARASTVYAEEMRIKSILNALPTGYNRDGQETKEPYMKGLAITSASVSIMEATIAKLEVVESKLTDAFKPEVYATDVALELVVGGMPFRDAYREVKTKLNELSTDATPESAIAKKTHEGACANLRLDIARDAVNNTSAFFEQEAKTAKSAYTELLGIEMSL